MFQILEQNKSRLYIECRPQKRTIKINHLGKFYLQFPYIYFKVYQSFYSNYFYKKYNAVKIGFSEERVDNYNDFNKMKAPPLPNINEEFEICMGSNYQINSSLLEKNFLKLANFTVESFFVDTFNVIDYSAWLRMYKAIYGDYDDVYKTWQSLTKENKCIPLIPYSR